MLALVLMTFSLMVLFRAVVSLVFDVKWPWQIEDGEKGGCPSEVRCKVEDWTYGNAGLEHIYMSAGMARNEQQT